MGVDPIWQVLADCPITLMMSKLLNLVPRFGQAIETRLREAEQVMIPANFVECTTGLSIVDHHNPTIKVIIKSDVRKQV